MMMKSSRLEKGKNIEDNVIKDAKNIFRLKKEIDDSTIKDLRNLFRLKKEIMTPQLKIQEIALD